MLSSLYVKNLAIIDEAEVEFGEHLNILTGETGAGKSILIGSINLALGNKASADMIRKGAEYGLVELVFHMEDAAVLSRIEEMDLSVEDNQVILSRKIMKTRSICKVNGETVTAGVLKEIAGLLIDIHGQHEHQSLLYKAKHLDILDRYAKDSIGTIKEELAAGFAEYTRIKSQISKAAVPEEERLRELSFLEYEKGEIEGAKLKAGEDAVLEARYKKLSNANMIMENIGNAYRITGDSSDSVSDGISRVGRLLSRVAEYDEELSGMNSMILEIDDLLSGFNREISDYLLKMGDSSEEFTRTEERLNLINGLKAKFGNSIEEIHTYYDTISEKLENYKNHAVYMEALQEKLDKSRKKVEKLSDNLSQIRRKKAAELSESIRTALVDLNFLEVKFSMDFDRLEHYTQNGFDGAEFFISTNPGEEPRPLGKVASGGELSRIMLAIKSVLADKDAMDTLIFDEIDVGVSGRTAQKVSEKLSLISGSHQVICITHLPQIAAMADTHFVIEKFSKEEQTKTMIRCLDKEESIEELARILGGAKITDAVLLNAREMKELAEHTKIYSF